MTDRAIISRCVLRLALDGKRLGLTENELAAIFAQEGLDRAVSVAGPRRAAAWLRRWAAELERNPRKFRGMGCSYVDGEQPVGYALDDDETFE